MTQRVVVLIVGPPGSGKSTLAASSGLRHLEREQYATDREFRAAAQLAAARPDAQLAVVRTCPTWAEQAAWAQALAATQVVVMDTPADECRRRCHARHRPKWRGEVAAVAAWYAARAAGPPAPTPSPTQHDAGLITSRRW